MRFLLGLLGVGVACALACEAEKQPPLLGDSDSAAPPSPGGGGGGGDAATSDGGSSLTSAAAPTAIVVTGGLVYFANYASGAGDGTISVVSTSGGTATDLVTGLSGPRALAVTGGTIYFTLAPTSGTGGLSSVPITGGAPTAVQSGVTGAYGLATDGVDVYWTLDNGGVLVDQVAVGGTTPKQILDFGGDVIPTGLALSGSDLYVPTSGTQAAVFWGTASGGANLTPLDTQSTYTFADVVVGTNAVYATLDDVAPAGAIVSFPLHGGVATTVASGLSHPQRLALDGTKLYFTATDDGDVWVKDLTTSDAPVLFASGLSSPLPIAVADAVYVGDIDAIVRIPKL